MWKKTIAENRIEYITDAQKSSVNHISVEFRLDTLKKSTISSIHFLGEAISEIFQNLSENETTKKFTGLRGAISFKKSLLENSLTVNAYTLLKKYGANKLLSILNIVSNEVEKITPSFSSIHSQFIEDIQNEIISENKIIKFQFVEDNKEIDFANLNEDNHEIQEEKLKLELIELYYVLDNAFSKILFEAKNNNKIPLVITGEEHTKKKSLLVELILTLLAKKYAFKNLAMEITAKSLQELDSSSSSFQILESVMLQRNFHHVHKIAKESGMTIIPAEGNFLSWNSELREKNMLNALQQLTAPTIFITGLLHLEYFLSQKESLSNFECLFINAGNAPQSMNEIFGEKILDSQFVIQAVIKTEVDKVSSENLIDICYKTLEKINESFEIESLIKLSFLNKSSRITKGEELDSKKEDLKNNFQPNVISSKKN